MNKHHLKNRKAQAVKAVSAIIIALLVLSIAIPFARNVDAEAPAKICSEKCAGAVAISADAYELAEDTDAGWWSFKKFVKNPAASATRSLGDTLTDVFCKTCTFNCEGRADEVAVCLYKKASTTYYALLGGYKSGTADYWDPDIVEGSYTNFNLFKITADVEYPGIVRLDGECSNYITTPNENYDCSVEGGFDNGICYEQEDEVDEDRGTVLCKIKFNQVNKFTMGISMIEQCQIHGIDSSKCKCFAKLEKGYTESNGLPLGETAEGLNWGTDAPYWDALYGGSFTIVFKDILEVATYANEDPAYKGCGHETKEGVYPIIFETGRAEIEINSQMIVLGLPTDLKKGEGSKTIYSRLAQPPEKVVLSLNELASECIGKVEDAFCAGRGMSDCIKHPYNLACEWTGATGAGCARNSKTCIDFTGSDCADVFGCSWI